MLVENGIKEIGYGVVNFKIDVRKMVLEYFFFIILVILYIKYLKVVFFVVFFFIE